MQELNLLQKKPHPRVMKELRKASLYQMSSKLAVPMRSLRVAVQIREISARVLAVVLPSARKRRSPTPPTHIKFKDAPQVVIPEYLISI